jgi:hypothetical protein
MAALRFLWGLIWSPVVAGLAALYLAVQGLLDERDRSGRGIVVAAGFLAISSVVSYLREQSLARRMASANLRLTQRLTSLIGSLGEISGDGYQCWKVDLYTGHWRVKFSRQFPWILGKRLIKRASVSLVSTIGMPDSKDLVERGPVGRCFLEQQQVLWLDPETGATHPRDCHGHLDIGLNERLAIACGALRAVPVASHLEQDCVGVLSVQVEPQYAARLAGTIILDACASRLRAAAVDVHQIIRA